MGVVVVVFVVVVVAQTYLAAVDLSAHWKFSSDVRASLPCLSFRLQSFPVRAGVERIQQLSVLLSSSSALLAQLSSIREKYTWDMKKCHYVIDYNWLISGTPADSNKCAKEK